FRIDPAKAREITIQLADYMRFNLNLVSKSLIMLEREIKHLEEYIEIIEMRFSKRLTISLKIEPDMSHVLIPPSTIQPIRSEEPRLNSSHVSISYAVFCF